MFHPRNGLNTLTRVVLDCIFSVSSGSGYLLLTKLHWRPFDQLESKKSMNPARKKPNPARKKLGCNLVHLSLDLANSYARQASQ